jgi:N,N'-diacetyllegionaminate synthase
MVEIIAEIGVNHNGNPRIAIELINAAKAAGCDVVKFQLWNTERVYPRERWEEMKALELTRDQIAALPKICDDKGIRFLCTPDDIDDAQFLYDIGCRRLKIGSSNVTNLPLLREVATMNVGLTISTGASNLREVCDVIEAIRPAGSRVNLLHCVSSYPAPLAEMNLRVMTQLQAFGFPVGLSDHTVGTTAAMLALAMGASTIEKHLTFDRAAVGLDHRASLDPVGMKHFVDTLRICEEALGDGRKRIMPCEAANRLEYDRFVAHQIFNLADAEAQSC